MLSTGGREWGLGAKRGFFFFFLVRVRIFEAVNLFYFVCGWAEQKYQKWKTPPQLQSRPSPRGEQEPGGRGRGVCNGRIGFRAHPPPEMGEKNKKKNQTECSLKTLSPPFFFKKFLFVFFVFRFPVRVRVSGGGDSVVDGEKRI